jgi:hypothetical protein
VVVFCSFAASSVAKKLYYRLIKKNPLLQAVPTLEADK